MLKVLFILNLLEAILEFILIFIVIQMHFRVPYNFMFFLFDFCFVFLEIFPIFLPKRFLSFSIFGVKKYASLTLRVLSILSIIIIWMYTNIFEDIYASLI